MTKPMWFSYTSLYLFLYFIMHKYFILYYLIFLKIYFSTRVNSFRAPVYIAHCLSFSRSFIPKLPYAPQIITASPHPLPFDKFVLKLLWFVRMQ